MRVGRVVRSARVEPRPEAGRCDPRRNVASGLSPTCIRNATVSPTDTAASAVTAIESLNSPRSSLHIGSARARWRVPWPAVEWLVVVLVLLAALLHASWNAAVKVTGDSLLAVAVVMATCSVLALAVIPFVPLPAPPSRPYLALSVVLHGLYNAFLVLAYRSGDLSQVYPIARGLAPAGVAVLAASFAGETLTAPQVAALAVVSAAIGSLALAHGWPARRALAPVAFAVATGVTIGSYSFVDGQGVRLAGPQLSYISWQFFLAGLPITVVALLRRRGRLRSFLARSGRAAAVAGCLAAVGYGTALWAMTVAPMALIVSLRETSVIFAALIGTRLLGEPFGRRRVAAATAVAGGIVALGATG